MTALPLSGSDPVALPGLAVVALAFLAFVIALYAARRRSELEGRGTTTRSRRSMLGIVAQGIAVGIVAAGAQRVTLDPLSTKALVEALVVALLMAGGVTLFVWASRTMGRNWSLVARTRDDHVLVTNGPFAHVHHPIYVALALVLIALAIAFGHTARLWVAIPIYALGTWIRVAEEERLLRAMFGAAYDAYAARVKRFVPGVF